MAEHKAVTTQDDPIIQMLLKYKKTIAAVLPRHLTPERALRVASTVIFRTPKLRDCTPLSLVNGIIEISMLGLDLGRTAHLVPFKKEAVVITDYKGEIELAHRSGQINSFPMKAVYANDQFDYQEGTDRWIKHKPATKDRGQLVAAYAIVNFKHGGFDFEVVHPVDVEAVKKTAPAAKSPDSPWNKPDQEHWMWMKTAVHRLAKRIPQSPELSRAIELEDLLAAGLGQDLNHVSDEIIDIEPVAEKEKDQKEAIRDKLNKIKEKPEGYVDPNLAEDKKPTPPPEYVPPEEANPLQCQECGFIASSPRGLKRHITMIHKKKGPDLEPSKKSPQEGEERGKLVALFNSKVLEVSQEATNIIQDKIDSGQSETDQDPHWIAMNDLDEFLNIKAEEKGFSNVLDMKAEIMKKDVFKAMWEGYLKWMRAK